MAPVVPNPRKIKSFASEAAFDRWLRANHSRETEIWLDDESFLQRYTPRRAKSLWSQVNREHVSRLTAAGRMQLPGQRQVDAARADGRWDAAYAPMRSATAATIPADLRAAIEANPRARRTFRTLGRRNLFALVFRTNNMKTPAGRARKIASLVAMLARGEVIIPESGRETRTGRGR